MDGQLDGLRRWLVPLGLAASFAANDGEELATMVASSRRAVGALPIGGGCATAPCGSTNGTSTRPSP